MTRTVCNTPRSVLMPHFLAGTPHPLEKPAVTSHRNQRSATVREEVWAARRNLFAVFTRLADFAATHLTEAKIIE